MSRPLTQLELRRALEALRSGVPNRDVVRALGSSNASAAVRFERLLRSDSDSETASGLLLSGGFGSGKSHLLEYFEHLALSANFVVSRVVISKETPMYDLGKVFKAAADSAVVPGRSGQAIQEIAHGMRPNTERYAKFYQWANSADSGLAPIFPATLMLHERLNNDPELVEEITNFWAGEKFAIGKVRDGLKQINAAKLFSIKAVAHRNLGSQRFSFIGGLIKGAGYSGWVILIDEVELVGRYTPLQRGRSYAAIARWLETPSQSQSDSVKAVLAITDDFALAVLDGKGDRDTIGDKLRVREPESVARAAELGMTLIDQTAVELPAPSDELLKQTYGRLKEIHSSAHDWTPPDIGPTERTIQRPIRSYVRRWINEWDLRRLNPDATIEMVDEQLDVTYETDEDLEVEAPDNDE